MKDINAKSALRSAVVDRIGEFVKDYGLDGESMLEGRDVPYSEVMGALAFIRDAVDVVSDCAEDIVPDGARDGGISFDVDDNSVSTEGVLSEGAKICRRRVTEYAEASLDSLDGDMTTLFNALQAIRFVDERERDHIRVWLDSAIDSHMDYARAWRYIIEWLDTNTEEGGSPDMKVLLPKSGLARAVERMRKRKVQASSVVEPRGEEGC